MNKKLKRTISAVLASAVMLTSMTGTQVIASADSTSVTAAATAEKTYKITSKNVTTYLHTYNDKSKTKVVVDKHLCKHTNVLIFSRR